MDIQTPKFHTFYSFFVVYIDCYKIEPIRLIRRFKQFAINSEYMMVEIKRDIYLQRLVKRMENGRAKVITGIRRCGKSYLLFTLFRKYLLSNGIDESHVITIALDDDEYEHLLDRHALGLEIRSRIKDEKTYYVFLDEIQNVEGFEMVINGLLHKPNVDIYVTGSNSRFLSSDIITEFRGRGDEVRVRPLSFSEIRPLYDSDDEAWDDYFNYGGLPAIYAEGMDDEQKVSFLEYVTRAIYIKDIVERNKLRNDKGISSVLDLLSSAIGSLTNPLKLANTFKSKGQRGMTDKTISNYLKFIEEAYMVERVQRYDIKGKDYIESPYKFYFSDIGVRNSRIGFRQVEETHIMENIIYNELKTRGYLVDVGIVEHRDKSDDKRYINRQYEVNFVANLATKRYYIQSALTLLNEGKLEQELKSLSMIRDSFKKILITRDRIKPRRTEDGILIINLFDFLNNTEAVNQ